jgi:hypothetical protein
MYSATDSKIAANKTRTKKETSSNQLLFAVLNECAHASIFVPATPLIDCRNSHLRKYLGILLLSLLD